MKYGFRKEERLNKEKLIKELFEKGSSFYLFPFKVIIKVNPDQNTTVHQVLISVSKRNFKKAVDRNKIKRRIRESYRLNKTLLPDSPKLLIAYIYNAKEILTFAQIQERLVKTFNRFDYVEKI
ncbi:ribonuclease P protein component [Chryseosolibacter indicus]|uniref:Ribonuclease P protein component n=1 Tax=Chryseosolibacter indicus TaxID=2782351 RepID=A0ABS5VXB1_9BACT|nr:ribonuclease P protein component [Chryseosolibacter indicus]MBT1706050.1 ribonuclease P protein component [Chryseosolibacter indicus]